MDAVVEHMTVATDALPRVQIWDPEIDAYRVFEEFISPEIIDQVDQTTADHIQSQLPGKEVVLVSVEKGGRVYRDNVGAILRAAGVTVTFAEIQVASMDGTISSGDVVVIQDLDVDITDQDVWVLDDLDDTSLTLGFLRSHLSNRGAASMKFAVNFAKRRLKHEGITPPDFIGMWIDDVFVLGRGLDFRDVGRDLPGLFCLVDAAENEAVA